MLINNFINYILVVLTEVMFTDMKKCKETAKIIVSEIKYYALFKTIIQVGKIATI